MSLVGTGRRSVIVSRTRTQPSRKPALHSSTRAVILKMQVDALSEALSRRADAARRSTAAHRAALGAAALAAALEDGRPVARELGVGALSTAATHAIADMPCLSLVAPECDAWYDMLQKEGLSIAMLMPPALCRPCSLAVPRIRW